MCFSADASFTTASLLIAGGAYCLHKARQTDKAYVPLALFPLIVGIQQAAEGFVWTGFSLDNQNMVFTAALIYLFFVWIFWPTWVPYMTARLEPDPQKKKIFFGLSAAGIFLGLLIYIPLFWGPEWFDIIIKKQAIVYQCTLITAPILPKSVIYLTYLSLIALAPILSSLRFLKIWGIALTAFVPVTYLFYRYADISVLCFFAAFTNFYIIYIITKDKCARKDGHNFSRRMPT